MSGVSLHGAQEMLLHRAVKIKLGLPCRPQDGRDARVTGFLPRRAADAVWNQPKSKKYVAINKAELKI